MEGGHRAVGGWSDGRWTSSGRWMVRWKVDMVGGWSDGRWTSSDRWMVRWKVDIER